MTTNSQRSLIHSFINTLVSTVFLGFMGISLASASESINTQATQETESTLRQLHELRLHSLKTITNFLMYSRLEGDPKYKSQLEEHRTDAHNAIEELQIQVADQGHAAQIQGLANQWVKVEKLIDINIKDIQDQGYSDLRMVSDMVSETRNFIGLTSTAYTNIKDNSGTIISHWTERSRELSLMMQNIAVLYIGKNSSELNVVSIGSDESVDTLAVQFKDALEEMKSIKINTPEIAQTLSSVETKWSFIEKSLMNPNVDSIPYLITRYSDRITNSMEIIANQYQEQNS